MGLVAAWYALSDVKINITSFNEFLKFKWLLEILMDYWFWILDLFISLAIYIINLACTLMPSIDLFGDIVNSLYRPVQVIGYLNWVLPMDVVTGCLLITSLNFTAYYGGGWALRWLKIIK
ncbi:MAG: hypothetical protein OCC45_06355 [Desulfotalea sp.]